MYPYEVIFGMGFYEIFLTIGLLAALLVADRLGIKRGFSVKLQKLVIIGAVAAILLGFGGAVLFQAFYDFLATGKFVVGKTTGMTFYGGFIFGVLTYLAVWFGGGKLWKISEEVKTKTADMTDIAAVAVPMAHGFGRLGCFFAGCCHGKETDAWYGVKMLTEDGWKTVVPVQLYEAIVLLVLAGALLWLFFRLTGEKRIPLLPVYGILYGIWRFCIEYARDDDRGATIVAFLSPSQLIAVLLISVGVGYFALWYRAKKVADATAKNGEDTQQEIEEKE